ncbi:MAG: hypothetical protein ABFR75_14725 [Acidobacteriota bacterium]
MKGQKVYTGLRIKNRRVGFISRIIWIQIFFILFFHLSYGEKMAELPMVMKPFSMTIGQGRLYIIEEKSKIHIFKIGNNNARFIKTFGTYGEGPGEFRFIHRLAVRNNYLEIPTSGKYARFTLDGKLIDEKKLPFRVFKNGIYKTEKNYLIRDFITTNKSMDIKIKLYGSDLNLLKELGVKSEKFNPNRINVAGNYFSCFVDDNMIYIVESTKETTVKKYDQDGKFLSEIKLLLESIQMDAGLREKMTGELSEGMNKAIWKVVKKRFFLPDYVPGLNWFGIDNGRIIVRTYRFNDDKAEFVFFDHKGKELKRVFLYDTGRTSGGIRFCFNNGYYYYLKENVDDEIWELFVIKIF